MNQLILDKTIEGISAGYIAIIMATVGALAAYIRYLVKNLITEVKANEEGTKSLLHGRIYKDTKKAMECNCITEEDLRNLEHYFKPYEDMGGNGLAKIYMERCRELPIKNDCEEKEKTKWTSQN